MTLTKANTPRGCEHPSNSAGNTNVSTQPGTDSGTVAPAPAPAMPDDLADVVTAWPALPAALKAGILAMVRAAKGRA